ncbi:MAG: EAL domain-containing protein [Spirochaetales bacterium]|nr:EAL domain-containing protein [Spirochaetales bacterium]
MEKISVLLIDDDEDEFIITRDLLAELGEGYRLSWSNNFERGLSEVLRGGYSVCLLDFHLGAQNGLEFLAEASLRNCTIPIILLTGQGDYEVDLAAMKAGASDYLDKRLLSAPVIERSIRYAVERKKTEEKIRFLAYYDQLTHLPNRTLFYDRLKTAFASAKRHGRLCAVMFLDIDNFKRINDTLGHTLGDRLIQEVARRLLKCIRKEDTVAHDDFNAMLDTVARLGGDEFTILLNEINEAGNASVVAERIRHMLYSPLVLEQHEINVTVSIGIAVYPTDGADIETVVKNADIAMYKSKSMGKNNFQYFNASMNSTALRRLAVENDLRKALKNEELELYYQPIMDLEAGRSIGAEALLRWRHPEKGLISPLEFIPIAEEIGLIYELGTRVFEILKRDYEYWGEEGIGKPNVAVNISPRQLNQRNILAQIVKLIGDLDIAPGQLTLEITESGIINNVDEAKRVIEAVQESGVKVSLDDFGSGYSSFVILRQIKFDILKIDGSLISRITLDDGDATIVKSLVTIGRSMGLDVVAEGIETKEQLEFLQSQKCRLGQGFYFNEPLPRKELTRFLKRESPPPPGER